MKKMLGLVALSVIALALTACAQEPVAPAAAPAPAVAAPVEAAARAEAAAPAEITVEGVVSVVPGPDGAALLIFINPAEGHGYKVDLVNGEGKTLADKNGKTVKATGVDANRLFNVTSITVVE